MDTSLFALLAALAPTMAKKENEAEKLLNKIEQEINANLITRLSASTFNNRQELISELQAALADARIISVFPELINKACIGIIYDDSLPWKKIERDFKKSGLWNFPDKSPLIKAFSDKLKHMPLLMLPSASHNGIVLADLDGLPIDMGSLSRKEGANSFFLSDESIGIFSSLAENNIDARDLVSAMASYGKMKHESAAYLFLPASELSRTPINPFLNHCDAFFVLHAVPDASLQALAEKFKKPVHLFNAEQNENARQKKLLHKVALGTKVEIMPFESLSDSLTRYNGEINHLTLKDRILSCMLWVLEAQISSNREVIQLEHGLSHASLLHDYAENEKEAIASLNPKLKSITEKHEAKIKDFYKAEEIIIQAIEEWNEKIKSFKTPAAKPPVSPWINAGQVRPESLWRRIIMRALVCEETQLAREYQEKYKEYFPDQAFITGLYLKFASKEDIGQRESEKLRTLPDTPEALRAKLYFADILGLNTDDKANIAHMLPNIATPDERFYRAVYLNKLYKSGKQNETYQYSFVEELYRKDRDGATISDAELDKLRWLNDSPEALRAKIFFASRLNLSGRDIDNIKNFLNEWQYSKIRSGIVPPPELERYILPRDMAFLNSLYEKHYQGREITAEEIEKLRWLPDSPQVFYAKMFFAANLGLSGNDIGKIEVLLFDWDAKHILQKDVKGEIGFEQVIDGYYQAAYAGHGEALECLAVYFAEHGNRVKLKELAQSGSGLAAYLSGLLAAKENDHKQGDDWIALAASLGSYEAQLLMANAMWNQVRASTNFMPAFAEAETAIFARVDDKAQLFTRYAKFYESIMSGANKALFPPEIAERLGILYGLTGSYKGARDILHDSHELPESRLVLALLLKYGMAGSTHQRHAIRLLNSILPEEGIIYHRALLVKDAWFEAEVDSLRKELNYNPRS